MCTLPAVWILLTNTILLELCLWDIYYRLNTWCAVVNFEVLQFLNRTITAVAVQVQCHLIDDDHLWWLISGRYVLKKNAFILERLDITSWHFLTTSFVKITWQHYVWRSILNDGNDIDSPTGKSFVFMLRTFHFKCFWITTPECVIVQCIDGLALTKQLPKLRKRQIYKYVWGGVAQW